MARSEGPVGWGQHTFYVPVMGTGFSIDTPLRVARYGISSVISLVDDDLIERMRALHCARENAEYQPIAASQKMARSRRITAYLDFLDASVRGQMETLRRTPMEPGSDPARYFELLPECPSKRRFRQMMECSDPHERAEKERALRDDLVAGSIDVNVMSKIDRRLDAKGVERAPHDSDALAAVRGFAESTVRSAIVLSAGMNARLFSYMAEFQGFFSEPGQPFRKRIVLKVGSYRSAEVQCRALAKRGLWVSEIRVESGLNCGGHAFASDGGLLGVVLAELRDKRLALRERLLPTYNAGLSKLGRPTFPDPPEVRLSVQGGIGTAREDAFLREQYGVDATGWGSPFLLVPEVTNVDDETRRQLVAATPDDIELSDVSPLGVRFWSLRTSSSEEARRRRIEDSKPGSPCPKGYLAAENPFGDAPLCPASRAYQSRELKRVDALAVSEEDKNAQRRAVVTKACICHDLGGGVLRLHGIDPRATPAVCPGPNIVHFKRVASLDEMVAHIYGRADLVESEQRPHVFSSELGLYVAYLEEEMGRRAAGTSPAKPGDAEALAKALLEGIEHYRGLAPALPAPDREGFGNDLDAHEHRLRALGAPGGSAAPTRSEGIDRVFG